MIDDLIGYGADEQCFGDSNSLLIDDCRKIAQRLLSDQLEGGLDRLNTFVNKFIRVTCEPHGIEINQGKPLHSVFGEYVKALRDDAHLESVMTEHILKSSISVSEAFNDVRNNKSLAHDNPILNYDESLLIFTHVAASIHFIKSLETKIKANKPPSRLIAGQTILIHCPYDAGFFGICQKLCEIS
ncbi:abortive infection family protein [Nitrosospira sp. NpAV]|uniref:abortive infection family protein n=1 Tax=Nitrosospira sp. NpAV TaxID=58133 RepID=UPI001E3C22A5|nr:abortive infection family protein [Nitrosospira sp. NpAV]